MIRILNEKTINKIAAGEVIERPLNIVKELVENSMDAGATRIVVNVEGGGSKKITIRDNGIGIDYEDLKLAFYPHATSKLTSVDDLMNIKSFGFRGEALSSIASVSIAEIKSKTRDNKIGYKITSRFGEMSDVEETAMTDGTEITVNNLFDNVPVRKTFLKSEQVESAKIYDIVEKIALSHKEISIKYIQDNKEKFQTSGDNNLANIVYTLYGKEISDNIINIDDTINHIRVSGIIGTALITRNNRNDEIFFVNKRYVKNNTLYKAVEDAYKSYLMQHKFPFAILNIDIDTNFVDVNIHPQKLEVRFANFEDVYVAVFNAIDKVLKNYEMINKETLLTNIEKNELEKEEKFVNDKKISFKNSLVLENNIEKQNKETNIEDIKPLYQNGKNINNDDFDDSRFYKKIFDDSINDKNSDEKVIYDLPSQIDKTDIIDFDSDYKYLGQVFGTYLLIEHNNKLYIIDQHAAMEKINYEKFVKQIENNTVNSQFIMPIVLTLTPIQHQVLKENILDFKLVGFDIEFFGDRDIKVSAVPYILLDIGKKDLLLEMIDDFSKDKSISKFDSIKDKIASISCKKAVKGNTELTDESAKNLIKQLFMLDNPYNCPHGRPTTIEISKYEFEKKFKRIV